MKFRDLLIITAIYIFAFIVGLIACIPAGDDLMLKLFVFDVAATVATFAFSVILNNSSVYDPYWSLTPMVMSIWLFIKEAAFDPIQLLFLLVFNLWGLRLTLNWVMVFTDFSYEDWRYRKFRNETPKIFWPVVNFFGIHMMPTLVVFAGMLPMFPIAKGSIGIASVPGILVMLMGIAFEFFADRQMHAHLAECVREMDTEAGPDHGAVCRKGLWRFSRHPNYLGEISFWVGVFLVMIPYAPEKVIYGAGCLAVAILFNVVSIPLMEKRQLSRRPEYQNYKRETSRLLILPPRVK